MSNVPESVWVQWENTAVAVQIFKKYLDAWNVGQVIEAARVHPQLHGIVPQHGALELLKPGEDGALLIRNNRTSALTLMVSFLRACRCRCCIVCPALRGCFPSFIGLCVLVLGGLPFCRIASVPPHPFRSGPEISPPCPSVCPSICTPVLVLSHSPASTCSLG